MKKILLTMAFVLTALGNAWADDVMTASDITIPQGSTATLTISLSNTTEFRQLFQMDIELPEGVSVLPNSQVLSSTRIDETATSKYGAPNEEHSGYRLLCFNTGNTNPISGNSGSIIQVDLYADPSLPTGVMEQKGRITGIKITKVEKTEEVNLPNIENITITIGAPLGDKVELYEEIGNPTKTTKNVNVTVHRRITANQWSTICLPFAMTEGQVKAAFGDDVELADLSGGSLKGTVDEDGMVENLEQIGLTFSSTKSILKDNPYLIKVSKGLSSFDVMNVKINPKPDNAWKTVNVTDDESNKHVAKITGVYTPGTIGVGNIFLSGNKFWSSNGSNSIKAFRAYFSFTDADGNTIVIDETSSSRITMSVFDDDATKIKDVRSFEDDGNIYNLSGQKVERLNKKGLYIKGGKKVVIK